MNEEIKAEIRAELKRRGMTVSDLARELGTSRPNLSRLLGASNKDARGRVPDAWEAIFERLGYEVTIRKKPPR